MQVSDFHPKSSNLESLTEKTEKSSKLLTSPENSRIHLAKQSKLILLFNTNKMDALTKLLIMNRKSQLDTISRKREGSKHKKRLNEDRMQERNRINF